MKLYITLFTLLLSVTAVSAATNDASSTFLAPAAAPTPTDSLPSGRHKVSSYRNGSSIEVVVEDQEIKSLKIDGDEIPANEYDQHQERVEELLGTNEKSRRSSSKMRVYRWSEEDMEGLEERLEGMGDSFDKMGENFEFHFEGMGEDLERMGENFEFRFEGMGEGLERMGERLGESLERMFEFDSNGSTMRFEFRGDGDWDMDSIGGMRSFEWHSDDNMDPKGLNREMPADGRSEAEAEIREMETMIERMERRKERMQADLERKERDLERQSRDLERQSRDLERQQRDLERQGQEAERDTEREIRKIERIEIKKEQIERREASYEVIVQQLQREGLIEDSGRLRKLTVDADNLKVNGKKASKEGHARFLELYEQQTGRPLIKGSSISIRKN